MKMDEPKISQLSELRCLWREAFGDTEEFLYDFEKTAFDVQRCRCVTMNGKVVAALYWFHCLYKDKPIAYLYAIATAKEYQGQGICHRLMENTKQHLTNLGYEGIILVPGREELFEFYQNMGYGICSYMREFHCTAKEESIAIRIVNQEEYASLRRQRLPEGGVIQENENLTFLKTQAEFYAGEDFLLVACEEGDVFYGLELLGDDSVASGVLQALGYKKGIFRIPGGNKEEDSPFAMYQPLGNSRLMQPSYFGLAYD